MENYLTEKERGLFSLEERKILYDLTNMNLEGKSKGLKKAKRGRSKQKRSDCPQLTLVLVIDEKGFPKKSEIFDSNVSEHKTLLGMVEKLGSTDTSGKKKTLVIGAGIATEEPLKILRDKGYDYICVAMNKPATETETQGNDGLVTVKEDAVTKVEIKLIKRQGESILYCMSHLKGEKKKAYKNFFVKE